MSNPNIDDMLKRCGMVETVPGSGSGAVSWTRADEISTNGLGEEFPGLHIKSQGIRAYPGQPMTWEYEVAGPVEQVKAFVLKYGNDNLKAEVGLL